MLGRTSSSEDDDLSDEEVTPAPRTLGLNRHKKHADKDFGRGDALDDEQPDEAWDGDNHDGDDGHGAARTRLPLPHIAVPAVWQQEIVPVLSQKIENGIVLAQVQIHIALAVAGEDLSRSPLTLNDTRVTAFDERFDPSLWQRPIRDDPSSKHRRGDAAPMDQRSDDGDSQDSSERERQNSSPVIPLSQDFYERILPSMQRLCLRLPEIFPEEGPVLLRAGALRTTTLSQLECAVLLANMFFCTLSSPVNYLPRAQRLSRFFEMFVMAGNIYGVAVLNYFSRIDRIDEQTLRHWHVSYRRQRLTKEARQDNLWEGIEESPIVEEGKRDEGEEEAGKRDEGEEEGEERDDEESRTPHGVEASLAARPLRDVRLVFSGSMFDSEKYCTLQANFANAYLGGGVLRGARAQEEIMISTRPDMFVGLLLSARQRKHESICIVGARRYSSILGYGRSLHFAGNYSDGLQSMMDAKAASASTAPNRTLLPDADESGGHREAAANNTEATANNAEATATSSTEGGTSTCSGKKLRKKRGRKKTNGKEQTTDSARRAHLRIELVAMDAGVAFVRDRRWQFLWPQVRRDIHKCFAALGARTPWVERDMTAPEEPLAGNVATGGWGTGAFGGCKHLKFIQQWIAASAAGRDLSFYCFRDKRMYDDLWHLIKRFQRWRRDDKLPDHLQSVGALYSALKALALRDDLQEEMTIPLLSQRVIGKL